MNAKNLELAEGLVSAKYIRQVHHILCSYACEVSVFFLPDYWNVDGWLACQHDHVDSVKQGNSGKGIALWVCSMHVHALCPGFHRS